MLATKPDRREEFSALHRHSWTLKHRTHVQQALVGTIQQADDALQTSNQKKLSAWAIYALLFCPLTHEEAFIPLQ